MILSEQNENPLCTLDAAQSLFKRFCFQIALINSLLVHAVVITYLVVLPTHNKKQGQEPALLTVQLIKIPTPMPSAKSMPAIIATQVPVKVSKSPIKKASTPPTKTASNPQPSIDTYLSNNNPVQNGISKPTQAPIVSSPEIDSKFEPTTIATAQLAAISATSTQTSEPVLAPASAISHVITENVSPVKTGVSISASYANTNHKPEYPSMSRRLNEQGTVTLKVLVTENGAASMVEVKTSSSYPLLDESAKNAVMQWRFNPATIDGKPISEFYSLVIPFMLLE